MPMHAPDDPPESAANSASAPLTNPANAPLTKKTKFYPKKKWGQNFLIDNHIIQQLCDQIEDFHSHHNQHNQHSHHCQHSQHSHHCQHSHANQSQHSALEIGPGRGALTLSLLQRQWSITAIEIDPSLVAYLHQRMQSPQMLAHQSRFKLIAADVRKWLQQDFASIKKFPSFVYSSLPYSSATHIMLALLTKHTHFRTGMFLLPKEMAQRICMKDGSLGIFFASLADFQIHTKLNLTADKFFPRPQVCSCLVSFVLHDKKIADPQILSLILKMSFSGRRKKIKNAWSKQFPRYQSQFCQLTTKQPALAELAEQPARPGLAELADGARQATLSLDDLLVAAEQIGMPMQERPEQIPPSDYYRLSKVLSDKLADLHGDSKLPCI